MSADGLGEGCSQEVRTVDEGRVVTIPGDAVIIGRSLVIVGSIHGGEGGGGEMGCHSRCDREENILS